MRPEGANKRGEELLDVGLRTFGRGFAIGWGARTALNVLPSLLKSLTQRDKRKFAHAIQKFGYRDGEIRFGLFLGGSMATYVLTHASIRKLRVQCLRPPTPMATRVAGYLQRLKPVIDRFAPTFAALLASPFFFLLPAASRKPLCLFFFVRALEIWGRYLASRKLVPTIPHADTLTMMGASAHVIGSWLMVPWCVTKTYRDFLFVQGGVPRLVLSSIVQCHQSQLKDPSVFDNTSLTRVRKEHFGVDFPFDVSHGFCGLVHPWTPSCAIAWLTFFKHAYARALPVYLPVYLVPLVAFHGRSLLRSPLPTLLRAVTGLGRSSLFLALYCTVGWLGVDTLHHLGFHSTVNLWLSGAMGGSAVIVERKSRRIELALYVLSFAVESFYNLHIGVRFRGGFWALFVFSFATLLQAFHNDRSLVRPAYLNSITFLLGQRAIDLLDAHRTLE